MGQSTIGASFQILRSRPSSTVRPGEIQMGPLDRSLSVATEAIHKKYSTGFGVNALYKVQLKFLFLLL